MVWGRGSDEERDDSDFSLESDSGGFGEEELTTDSGLDEDEWMEDIGNFLFDTTLNIQVAEVIGSDKYDEVGADYKCVYSLGRAHASVGLPQARSCVVPMTLQRYKKRFRGGNMSIKDHGNRLNKNASQIDLVWLVKWFAKFAEEVGEVVPVRVRIQKKIDSTTQRYYSSDKYTLLPSHFTWDAIGDEMHKFVESGLMVHEPARATMRKLLVIGIDDGF
ncbi:hypothetical protein PC119_g24674 [Phytophthora cactorum]|uniref:Uncharacterized protein n=1 Tax=Phytophthora cactorum TaxID=29920 RepID=A0A8T1DUX7_9STRA|nr:hypothetical protein PC117_g9401 [Phytophthora cactorum]KAG2966687.1 hypothetical protein PC119_g24674 [Phytophthora cactorum]